MDFRLACTLWCVTLVLLCVFNGETTTRIPIVDTESNRRREFARRELSQSPEEYSKNTKNIDSRNEHEKLHIPILKDGPMNDWIPADFSDLPRPDPSSTDPIDVYILAAPLLKWRIGDILGDLYNMTHGALSFKFKDDWWFSIEYDGTPSMFSSVLPDIVHHPVQNTTELQWKNFGAGIIYLNLNESYYTQGIWKVGQVSPQLYNNFLDDYFKQINQTKPFYQMMNIVYQGQTLIPSYDCFDFVYEAIGWLVDRGMSVESNTTLYKCWNELYVSQPPQQVEDDQVYHQRIVNYYELIELHLQDLDQENLFETITNVLLLHETFIRHEKDYYLLHVEKPYIRVRYAQQSINELLASTLAKQRLRREFSRHP